MPSIDPHEIPSISWRNPAISTRESPSITWR
jgi:hypothetical protein